MLRLRYPRSGVKPGAVIIRPIADELLGDWSDKTVPAPGHGFHEPRSVRVIVEGRANLLYGCVERVIEVHKRVFGPNPSPELFTGYHLAGTFREHGKYLKGLFLQTHADPSIADFASPRIHFVGTESDND